MRLFKDKQKVKGKGPTRGIPFYDVTICVNAFVFLHNIYTYKI